MEREQKFSEEDRRKVIEAVVATNAIITEEQSQKLAQAIGRKVRMQYEDYEYITDEDASYGNEAEETFTLADFNFVEDPKTGQKYLAFLTTDDGATNFPYWISKNAWEDTHAINIKKLTDHETGETLWSFEQPRSQVEIDAYGNITRCEDIIRKIKTLSASYSESKKN